MNLLDLQATNLWWNLKRHKERQTAKKTVLDYSVFEKLLRYDTHGQHCCGPDIDEVKVMHNNTKQQFKGL